MSVESNIDAELTKEPISYKTIHDLLETEKNTVYSNRLIFDKINAKFSGDSSGYYPVIADKFVKRYNVTLNYGNHPDSVYGCCYIGYNAGIDNVTNNRLIIENSLENENPLIDGNFENDTLNLNARVRLGTAGDVTSIHEIHGETNAKAPIVGGGDPLPLLPETYLKLSINNVIYKIPCYKDSV